MKKYILSLMTDQRNDLSSKALKFLLWILSLFYGAVVALTRSLYRWRVLPTFVAPKPVISIGNVTVGGSGKTPVAIEVARFLFSKGVKPVILTRGYMAREGILSDEAQMIQDQLPKVPVLVARDRVASIRKAESSNAPDIYICDDALQHWPLHRDLDVIVVDASNPFGNGFLLPRGILREPLTALRRAKVLLLTKIDQAQDLPALCRQLRVLNTTALLVESRYKSVALVNIADGATLPLGVIEGQPVIALSAIGNPASFERTVKDLGARIEKNVILMDHHTYSADDVGGVVKWARDNNISFCVTTHKDAVKIQAFKHLLGELKWVYLGVELEITQGKDEFQQQIMACAHR